ncbi:hypothetical protein SEA_OOGWAY_86 [Mycobacterium phage Oogway]|nr:hypothetical protein SEA_OOGWAY_86 [Mycobacterium phage Oogway]
MISSHRPIKPQTSASVADVVSYLGSFEMFKGAPVPKPAVHETEVGMDTQQPRVPVLGQVLVRLDVAIGTPRSTRAKYMADDHVSAA